MSKERMLALRRSLLEHGWSVSNEPGNSSAVEDLFDVENESLAWRIKRSAIGVDLRLNFQLADGLGNRTSDLRDAFFCDADLENGPRLYFSKINSEQWNLELAGFVNQLNGIESHEKPVDST